MCPYNDRSRYLPRAYPPLCQDCTGRDAAVLNRCDTDLRRDLAVKVLLETHEGKPELFSGQRCLCPGGRSRESLIDELVDRVRPEPPGAIETRSAPPDGVLDGLLIRSVEFDHRQVDAAPARMQLDGLPSIGGLDLVDRGDVGKAEYRDRYKRAVR